MFQLFESAPSIDHKTAFVFILIVNVNDAVRQAQSAHSPSPRNKRSKEFCKDVLNALP